MDELYTLELTYKQLLELQACVNWKTTSYSDRTLLNLLIKRIKEIDEQRKASNGEVK